jgi:hypothetical protein
MELHQTLCLSAKIVTDKTLNWLYYNQTPSLIHYYFGDHGAFIPLSRDTIDEMEKRDIPDDLFRHMKRAVDQGCTWLLLDPSDFEEKTIVMMGISTGHLEVSTRNRLNKDRYGDLDVERKKDYGWFLRMDQPFLKKDVMGFNQDLQDVIEFGLKHHVDWIMFDVDASSYEQLPYYESASE